MKVKLSYFRTGWTLGKWYSDAEFQVRPGLELFEIWKLVRQMLETKTLPGLLIGHSAFIVSVDVPKHPNRHPHLIIPKRIVNNIMRDEND